MTCTNPTCGNPSTCPGCPLSDEEANKFWCAERAKAREGAPECGFDLVDGGLVKVTIFMPATTLHRVKSEMTPGQPFEVGDVSETALALVHEGLTARETTRVNGRIVRNLVASVSSVLASAA